MEHVVFFPAPDGAPAFRRVPTLEEAVRLVEHLRNAEGVAEVAVHPLGAEVPLAFRAYYRVEVPPAPEPLGAVSGLELLPAVTPVAPAHVPVPEATVPEQPRGLEPALEQPAPARVVVEPPVREPLEQPALEQPPFEHALGFEEAFGLEQALAPEPAAEPVPDLFAVPEPAAEAAPAPTDQGHERTGLKSLGFFT